MTSEGKDGAQNDSRVSTTGYEPYYYEFAQEEGAWDEFPRKEIFQFINGTAKPGSQLLELGCGTGELLSWLRSDISYIGVELSEFAAAEARRRWAARAHAEFVASSGVPFPDASFDMVAAVYVLEHVTTPQEFLRQIIRVLRPGGRLIIAAPNLEFPLAYPNALRHRSRWYRIWFAVLRTWDYLLRLAGILNFRVIPENFSEHTGRYEKKDDDLRYVVSSGEVVRFLKRLGFTFEEEWGEQPKGLKKMIQWLPALRYYGKPLAGVFRKL